MTASISLPRANYKDGKAIARFYEGLLEKVSNVPGVIAVGAGSDLPWTGWDENAGPTIQGETPPPHQFFHARYHMATVGYFGALGIPTLRRTPDSTITDTADSPKVLIINAAMARFWQHGDALGGKISWQDHPKEKDWMTVVGIVGDVKERSEECLSRARLLVAHAAGPLFRLVDCDSLEPGTETGG